MRNSQESLTLQGALRRVLGGARRMVAGAPRILGWFRAIPNWLSFGTVIVVAIVSVARADTRITENHDKIAGLEMAIKDLPSDLATIKAHQEDTKHQLDRIEQQLQDLQRR